MNIPFAMLVGIGTLALFASGIAWLAGLGIHPGGPVSAESIPSDPVATGWGIALFWIGIVFTAGALVVVAVQFSIEQALNRLPESSSDVAKTAPLVSDEED